MDLFKSFGKVAATGFDGRGSHNFKNDGGVIWCTQCGSRRDQLGNLKNCSANNVANKEIGKFLGGFKL